MNVAVSAGDSPWGDSYLLALRLGLNVAARRVHTLCGHLGPFLVCEDTECLAARRLLHRHEESVA